MNDILKEKPQAIRRIGKKTFLAVDAYQPKNPYRAVYVNIDLFHKLFPNKKRLSFEKICRFIESEFSFTIDKQNATGKKAGKVYVDYQADPLNISLSGNLGSGRAYYAGACFNIKGEKTPLAKSEKRRFSDGLLEMERCLWEALVANGLQGAFENGIGGVLAVLDMQETCEVIWRDKPVKRGKIIRVDMNGTQDRISHLFHAQKPLNTKKIIDIAKSFGRLDGDKFIERIEHGAWSAGNVSPGGHLIDFDTVAAVKGRNPTYSSSQWYPENYFGHEHRGLAHVLGAIADDKKLNKDKISKEKIDSAMMAARQAQIEKRFTDLMGFSPADHQKFKVCENAIQDVCALWLALAGKGIGRMDMLGAKNPLSLSSHIFDFSAFFRIYPILRRSGTFRPADAFAYLCGHDLPDLKKKLKLTTVEKPYHDTVMQGIAEDIARHEDLNLLKIACLHFIRRYEELFNRLIALKGIDPFAVEERAYVINQDRHFLYPAYTLTYDIGERLALSPRHIHDLMQTMVLGTRRDLTAKICDIQFLNRVGYSFIEFVGHGQHHKGIALFPDAEKKFAGVRKIGNTVYKFTYTDKSGIHIYVSNVKDNRRLVKNFNSGYSEIFCKKTIL